MRAPRVAVVDDEVVHRFYTPGLVMRQSVKITLIGVVIGLAGAYGLTRLIATRLFSVKATDPATFVSVTAVLVAVVSA